MNSSHVVAPLGRMLWKEYRTQRQLWFAMLALGIVPQLLLRFAISDAVVRVSAVWVMAGVLPFLFVIGSSAILFAGEREERTVDWLLNLAVPPQWTLLAKWTFLLVATMALAAALSISALLLVWSGPVLAEESQRRGGFVFGWIVAFVGAFLWGVLGSLISRRVVIAVPAMGFAWLMTLIVPMIWVPALLGFKSIDRQLPYIQDRVVFGAFVAVAVANMVLGWRWCQGKYLDATVLDEVNLKVEAWWNRLRGRTGAKVRVPSGAEVDSPWHREWRRLVWQERYRDRYHRGLLYLGWIISLMLVILGTIYGNDLMAGVVPLIVSLPLVMGILGFRYDGEGQPKQFLLNRGVAARFLWCAKHAVWLPRAIWIPLLVWLVGVALQEVVPRPTYAPRSPSLLHGFSFVQPYPGGVLAFILLSYGCGHLAASMFQRTVLAGVVGLTATLLSTLWLVLALALDVPLWWSVGGLVAWIYGVGYWNAPAWLIERPLAGHLRRVAAYVIPPVLLIAAWGVWRAYEIPGFSPNLLSRTESFDRLQTANIQKQQLDLAFPSITPADQLLLDRLANSMGGFNREHDFELGLHRSGPAVDPDQPVDPIEAFWHNNEPRLKELLDITRRNYGPSASRWLEFAPSGSTLMPQQLLLLEAARLRTREGRLEDALNYYCASLRLASFWATNSGFSTRREAHDQQLLTLDGIVQWASHPDQTGANLRAARRRLQIEFDLFPPIQQTLVAEYRRELRTLEQTIQHGAGWGPGPQHAWQLLLIDYFRFLPWERVRAKRWLEQQLLDRDQIATQTSELLRKPGLNIERQLEQSRLRKLAVQLHNQARDVSWQLTTPLNVAPSGEADVVQSLLLEREVMMRESLLALSLLAWRQEHRQWPGTLAETLDGLPPITATDPWCGELFEYNGTRINQQPNDELPAVLLSTVGPRQLREVLIDKTPAVGVELWSSWGTRAVNDDRLRLKVDQGQLSFQVPDSVRLAPGGPANGG